MMMNGCVWGQSCRKKPGGVKAAAQKLVEVSNFGIFLSENAIIWQLLPVTRCHGIKEPVFVWRFISRHSLQYNLYCK